MAPPPQLQTWVPWSEAAGVARVTVEEFRDVLRNYRRSSLLIACSCLSVLFNFGLEGDITAGNDITAQWIPAFFSPKIAQRVMLLAQHGRLIFFQAQLRYLAREVIRLGTSDDDLPPVHDGAVGQLLLMAGELLYRKYVTLDDPLDEMANKIATFLPFYEIDSVNAPTMQFLRFYTFLSVIIPRLPEHLRFYDVAALFEEQFRFPLKEYCEFIFCFFMHATTQRDKKSLEAAVDSAIGIGTFRYTSVSPEALSRMFDTVCFTLDTPVEGKEPIGFADFDLLRDRPYLRYQEELFCLDYEFAANKMESGALWRVLRKLKSEADKTNYLSFWGYVFEYYVAWLFEEYASTAENRFYPSPTYTDDPSKQICDAIIVCGSTGVLVEAKLATCPSDVRYSGDYRKMRMFMEERLVVGKKGPVGVGQLLNAIENITRLPPSALPSWIRHVRKFIPLILTKDDIGSSWVVNSYLNTRFQEARKRHKAYTITPLVSMSVATLERSMHALRKHAFSDVLEDRIRSDKTLSRPFEAASKYAARGRAISMSAHFEIFKQLTEDVITDFKLRDPGVENGNVAG